MTDHYELLGVEPDATKDEIRSAYRTEIETADSVRRAELNRAWNVLSDPMQRQRYDEQRGSTAGGDDESSVPARKLTGARRGTDSVVLDADEPSTNGRATDARGGARPPAEPTVVLPAGMNLATKRERGFAILFDFAALVIIVLVCQQFVPRLVSSDYSKNRDVYTHQTDKADAAQKREDKANDNADKAATAAKKAEKQDDQSAQQDAQDNEAKFKQQARTAAHERKVAEDKANKASDELQGPSFIATGVAFVFAMLYCVPMTALSGQTFGKRIRKVWLVRTDGSKVSWGTALAHYVIPIAPALAIPTLGPLVALGIVFWSLRDRNGQGAHDKLAHTLVVDSPPSSSTKEDS